MTDWLLAAQASPFGAFLLALTAVAALLAAIRAAAKTRPALTPDGLLRNHALACAAQERSATETPGRARPKEPKPKARQRRRK